MWCIDLLVGFLKMISRDSEKLNSHHEKRNIILIGYVLLPAK